MSLGTNKAPSGLQWNQTLIQFILTALTLGFLLLGISLRGLEGPWTALAYGLAFLTGGIPAARDALSTLWNERKFDVDLLMVVAALGAASIGQAEDGVILLFLFSLSNSLQDWAMGRTKRAIEALMALNPQEAAVRRNGVERIVPIEDIAVGETLLVRPGERIAADGKITFGITAIDESPITGESLPVDKKMGDSVFSGTVNQQGFIEIQVESPAGESTLAKLIHLVETAQTQKSPIETLTERWESPYAMAVLGITPLVFAVLYILFQVPLELAWYRAITFMVVASPCAVVISTPAVMLSAMASAARGGVLFKSAAAVEQLGRIRTMAFDKTGTLTEGKMNLVTTQVLSKDSEIDILRMCHALESRSEHPIAQAIVRAAQAQGIQTPLELKDVQAKPGLGIEGYWNGQKLWAGNERMAELEGAPLDASMQKHFQKLAQEGQSLVFFGIDNRISAVLGVADQLRVGVKEALISLKNKGISTAMLTGDRPEVAQFIGNQLALDQVRGGLSPQDKLSALDTLGRPLAVIGDGVNDAPALAAADLGIAMAQGTDVALESADVVLVKNDIAKLSRAINLARSANWTVVFNLVFAFSIIAVVGFLSVLGYVPLPLGVIAHEGGTVFVVFMGLRLLAHRV